MTAFEIFSHQQKPMTSHAVRELYTAVDWFPNRSEEEIALVLDEQLAFGAWDGHRLVGFARVVSDQHFHAYIEDVMVHPEYQRRGIGGLLLAQVIEALAQIETVTLFCRPELVSFYRRYGFKAYPSQMVLHRKGVRVHFTS